MHIQTYQHPDQMHCCKCNVTWSWLNMQVHPVSSLQIHQTTYSDYELGRLNIPIPVLKQLAELFNTSIDYIVDLTDEVTPYEKKK